jgi:hypothetical protein
MTEEEGGIQGRERNFEFDYRQADGGLAIKNPFVAICER